MYKIVTLLTIISQLLFSATSEQVDKYMSLSHSDRVLIEIEELFSNINDSVQKADDNGSNQITLDYQIYIGKHISENEMDEILTLFRKPIMQQYLNEMDMVEIPEEEIEEFLATLKENPLSTERQDIINELVDNYIDEELLIKFYNSMMQRYRTQEDNNQTKKVQSTKKEPSEEEKSFIKLMKDGVEQELLYGTQVMNIEELKEIAKIMKSSIMSKMTRVENEAIIDIMNSFIKRIISRPKNIEKK